MFQFLLVQLVVARIYSQQSVILFQFLLVQLVATHADKDVVTVTSFNSFWFN